MLTPIPIVAIANLASFLVALTITWKLYRSYRRTNEVSIRYFLFCFISLTIFFALLAIPGFMTNSPFLLTLPNILATPFSVLGAMFFTLIPLHLLQMHTARTFYIITVLTALLIASSLRIIGFEELIPVSKDNFTFWIRPENLYLQISWIIFGITIFVSTLLAGITFLFYGRRQKGYLRVRSYILGISAILLSTTAAINYLIGSTPSIATLVLSSFLAVFSLLVLAFGIFYKKP